MSNRRTVAAAAASLAAAAHGGVEYTVTKVAPGAGRAINNAGEVVGWVYDADVPNSPYGWAYRGWVYRPGEGVTILPDPPGGLVFVLPADINDAGAIVGRAYKQIGWWETGWLYQDGGYTMLGGLQQDYSVPMSINNQGEVVGRSYTGGFLGDAAFYWSAATGMVDLFPGKLGTARDITDNGWVSGEVGAINKGFRMALGGEPEPLPYIENAYAINSHGHAVGAGSPIQGGDPFHWNAYFWSPGTGTITIANIGEDDLAFAINDADEVVGLSDNTGTGNKGWVWDPERGLRVLGEVIDPALELGIIGAHDINEKGQIVAIAHDNTNGDIFTVVLTPVGGETCAPDIDGNGQLNLFDFLGFTNLFNAGDPAADFDGNGVLNLFDFLAFNNAFNAGC